MTYRKWTGGPEAVLDYLNNAKTLGPFQWTEGLPLGGKTLVFTEPAHTITFPGDDGAVVPFSDVVQALREVPGLHVGLRRDPTVHGPQRFLSLYRDGGVGIGKDGTSNTLFGLSAEQDTRVKSPLPHDSIKMLSRPTPEEYEIIMAGADEDFEEPAAPRPKKST